MKRLAIAATVLAAVLFIATVGCVLLAIWTPGDTGHRWGSTAFLAFWVTFGAVACAVWSWLPVVDAWERAK